MEGKDYSFKINMNDVTSTNINRYSDGYNYANIGCRIGKREYMSVSYEWEGSHVPDFVMDVMDIMKSMGEEKASVDSDSIMRAGRYLMDIAAKMKPEEDDDPICPDCNMKKSECKCAPKKKKK